MSCRSSTSLLLFLLSVQSVDSTHARLLPVLPSFLIPEVDGFAVDDACMILPPPRHNPTPPPPRQLPHLHPSPGRFYSRKLLKLRSLLSACLQRNLHQSGDRQFQEDQSGVATPTLQPASCTTS
ncbi:unnamed protein product [Pleuronectes platessa]|uniref:Secreted protein n=1 Tax=Pleuronectes platessa TaxID=8262 RepID=A0A9N7UTS6_PLEPL|nr:unnamed protein product [Pleuronectes platessa]